MADNILKHSKVWRGTERVGIAMVHDVIRNYTVIVGRFKPPGNIGTDSSFQENVPPLLVVFDTVVTVVLNM